LPDYNNRKVDEASYEKLGNIGDLHAIGNEESLWNSTRMRSWS
jgi:hypothetical protein